MMLKWAVGAVALLCLVVDDSHAANSQAELYGKGRAVRSLVISPDGQQIAYISSQDGTDGVVIRPLKGSGGFRVPSRDLKLRNVEWSGPNHVLLYASATKTMRAFASPLIEFWGAFSLDVRSREIVQLLGRNRSLGLQSSLSDVRAKKWDENGTVLMAARTSTDKRGSGSDVAVGRSRTKVDLFEVDGNSGRGKRISKGGENTDQWVVRTDGTVIARVDHFDRSDNYRILAPEDRALGRNWKTIFSEEADIPNMTVWGTDQTGEFLIISTYQTTGRRALFEMAISDGAVSPTALFEHQFVDVDSVITDDYTGEVVGVDIIYAAREQQFFQSDFVAVVNAVEKALPDGYRVYIESWDKERTRFILFAQSSTDSGVYLLLNKETGALDLITRAYPDIKSEHLSPVTPFAYKTRDELNLQGYLTVPSNTKAENLPVVVMPHGGPESRDELGYDWWQQFLASQGYAVVQMNFRGSSGYGSRFIRAGYGQWGKAMQDDVTDAINYLIEKGVADPDRICIVGASYGGYAALAGAAFTPNLYKCAASYSGVSDLGRMLSRERKRFGAKSSTYEYWVAQIGEPGDEVNSRSPARTVDQIRADILLIHGKKDTVVDIDQSEVMAKALEKAGRPHEFIVLKGEDHWLSTEETRIAMLEALGGFLEQHLGPNAENAQAN
ncbi:MAG: alpha/beta fold hydrolase [Alphaproteobacteria bacterium]|nr:alpha/beta fold hydrolase [Alphaproteobacteria bacterium]